MCILSGVYFSKPLYFVLPFMQRILNKDYYFYIFKAVLKVSLFHYIE